MIKRIDIDTSDFTTTDKGYIVHSISYGKVVFISLLLSI